jgi:hypothetical protein
VAFWHTEARLSQEQYQSAEELVQASGADLP